MSKAFWLLKCCFTSTETVGLLRTGAQDGHLDFHTAPELCLFVVVNRLYIALFSALEQIHCASFLSFFLSFVVCDSE